MKIQILFCIYMFANFVCFSKERKERLGMLLLKYFRKNYNKLYIVLYIIFLS